jgi:hypothetical protein
LKTETQKEIWKGVSREKARLKGGEQRRRRRSEE